MPILDAQRLHKAYGPHTVLGSVDLTIDRAERLGLVGVNGSGKSTLARLLAGLESPDGGQVVVQRGARIVYLPQCPVLDPNRTARQEVLAGLTEWQAAEARYQAASAALAAGQGERKRLTRLIRLQCPRRRLPRRVRSGRSYEK